MMEIILSDAYFATKPKPKHSSQPKCDGKHNKMRNAEYKYKSKHNHKRQNTQYMFKWCTIGEVGKRLEKEKDRSLALVKGCTKHLAWAIILLPTEIYNMCLDDNDIYIC